MNKEKKEAKEITKYISDFISNYIYTQTESPHTLKSYRVALQLYLEYLEENGITTININYECFNVVNIEKWMEWLINVRKNKPQSVNNRLASLRVFLKYLGKKDISLLYIHTESSEISRKKAPKVKVKGISKEAVKTLFGVINQATKTGKRDITMFVLMYNTATRLSEILSLKLKDIHLDVEKPYIVIKGKGNKLRSLYLLPKTVKYLKKYILENHNTDYNENNYLFYSKVKGKKEKMTQPAIEKQLKKWAKIAHKKCKEVPENLHPHQLRHAAASHWLENGMNIVQISYLLGHEQLQTTMIYLEITTSQKAQALEKLNDTNNFEKKWKKDIKKLSDLCK